MSINIITKNRWRTVSADTLQSALNILDAQYNHCKCKQTATESQKAYYEGMKAMMDILLSEHYEHMDIIFDGTEQAIAEINAEPDELKRLGIAEKHNGICLVWT